MRLPQGVKRLNHNLFEIYRWPVDKSGNTTSGDALLSTLSMEQVLEVSEHPEAFGETPIVISTLTLVRDSNEEIKVHVAVPYAEMRDLLVDWCADDDAKAAEILKKEDDADREYAESVIQLITEEPKAKDETRTEIRPSWWHRITRRAAP